MAQATFPVLLGTGDHASRPAATDVGSGGVYSCTDHGLIYQTDGSSWSTWATLGGDVSAHTGDTSDAHDASAISIVDAGGMYTGTDVEAALQEIGDHDHTGTGDGGDLDAPVIDSHIVFNEESAPSTPSAGTVAVYAKSDGRIYSKDDAGVEYGPFDEAGAGAGAQLYQDSLTLHADGDEFSDDTLAAWTLAGGLTTGDVTAITTEPYDATCLDIVFAAQGDRMLRTIPSWTQIILTIHGITNSTPSSTTAAQAMMAVCVVDSAGDGTGFSIYNDGNAYLWVIDNYVYSSTSNAANALWTTAHGSAAAASGMPLMMRLRKSGTSIFGAVSYNGGMQWKESTARTDSLTHDRFGIIRLANTGGTNPTLRVGRIQIIT